jgi:uncharacterized protein YvpB
MNHGDGWPMIGYGVYAPPILALVHLHGLAGSFGGAHVGIATIRQALDGGDPVIVWVPKLSLYGRARTFVRRWWRAYDGRLVPWNEFEHAQVAVGYDASGIYLNNPDYEHYSASHWLWHYTWAEFQRGWDVLGDQAIVVRR